jgi:hypothetical protein
LGGVQQVDPKEMGIQPTKVGNPTRRLTVPAQDNYPESARVKSRTFKAVNRVEGNT